MIQIIIPEETRSFIWKLAVKRVDEKAHRYWGDTHKPDRNRYQDKYAGLCGEWAFKCGYLNMPFTMEDLIEGDKGIDFRVGPYTGQIKTTKWGPGFSGKLPDGRLTFYPWDKKVADLYVGITPIARQDQVTMGLLAIRGWIPAWEFEQRKEQIDFMKTKKGAPDTVCMSTLYDISILRDAFNGNLDALQHILNQESDSEE